MIEVSKVYEDQVAAVLTLSEQERLGRELHDTLGPQLTAISMLAASLHERLESHSADETALAAKLLRFVEQAKADVRAIAKGLLPVELDAEGLMSALGQLAYETQETHGVACRFDCDQPVVMEDNFAATRLFRIAKEAVHNAVKHAQAHEIVILLTDDDSLMLQVSDDGVGLPADAVEIKGNGMRMMRHRCQLVGGVFDVRPHQDQGTIVTCSIDKQVKENEHA
jgi:signal transduction histidine kinase